MSENSADLSAPTTKLPREAPWQCRLDTLNQAALHDETDRALTFPQPGEMYAPATREMTERLSEATNNAPHDHDGLEVWSFDIDLTVAIPEDTPGFRGPVPIKT